MSTTYQAHTPDASGFIRYSDDEHAIWHDLFVRQQSSIIGKACQDYLDGLDKLALPTTQIPQLADIDQVLQQTTGFATAAVPALISFSKFFGLLADQKFPVATFIRTREDFDYIQEPDIFHEIVGHCPLLTHPAFAKFTHTYGKLGLKSDKATRVFLARLYWFTMEFGLIDTTEGLRIYGGGILSSPAETEYALSDKPEYRPFNLNDILRTPYRIDKIQPIYYVIESPDVLFDLDEATLLTAISQAQSDGLYEMHPSLID
ncbi:phenylalanine 4-monooxygenase [Moraxella sp. FZLJ2107]|uniref:phenylalanine 4-monooxygenase n=1 Tax=unclassified Moraxella TaxID=2685852 RepID=UPI0020C8578E|nr:MULTISPECIES: phenylalanine 4-monooxygenase [unclassified Moraxella]UTO05911.1 phenylalanine 4-monooxygenase [Moraxella sp. FZLJ2107]UTO22647.1 phenylalanine 4-monooxygenase [Moraxella sp. FZLJ2109]